MMAVLSGRVDRRIFISVTGYQPGGVNTTEDLQRNLDNALGDFALAAAKDRTAPAARG